MNLPHRSPSHSENPGGSVVVIRGLTRVFKDFWGRPRARAVDGVDFDVRQGEVFGLLGPNGSGKSTTIKILLGLLHATSGHVEVFGHHPSHVPTKARIGYLPEESYLYRFLNSEETLDLFGGIFRLSKAERQRRTEQLLEMVGLKSVQRRSVGEFSKGMQRRIGLAQALINDPDLVILDEPTAGLDPVGCREVKDLILALARRGKTVILSSHLLADVEDVCDRVVVYYGGKVQALGSMKELLATPDSLRVTTPALSRETVASMISLLSKEVPAENIRLETPSRTLESLFLDIVEKARHAGGQTSGATSGNQVAAFIRGDSLSPETGPRILDRLAQAPLPKPAPASTTPETPREPLHDAGDAARLDRLTAAPSISPPQPTPSTMEPAPDPRLREAEGKLSSLVKPGPPRTHS
ncbi:MAG: ATP-binding cassette domain-containing protein [Verrucomicrobia bacterium]|nr:ATP-binding cassette domain-containing protein [Verrucomicrobiota bacterium]